MRVSRRLLAGAFIAVCACAPTPGASAGSSPPDDPVAAVPRYACGRFPFDPAMLQQPGDAERAAEPAAAALRAYLAAPDTDRTELPVHGWTLAGIDDEGAEFIATGVDPLLQVVSVTVRQDRGTWKAIDGGWCEARRVLAPGINQASWELRPGDGRDAGLTGFVALVREQACASGKPAAGRIVGPEIREQADAVIVTFGVRALDDGSTHTCNDTQPTFVEVTLPEPLGPRTLLDGGFFPPRDPTPAECCG